MLEMPPLYILYLFFFVYASIKCLESLIKKQVVPGEILSAVSD